MDGICPTALEGTASEGTAFEGTPFEGTAFDGTAFCVPLDAITLVAHRTTEMVSRTIRQGCVISLVALVRTAVLKRWHLGGPDRVAR